MVGVKALQAFLLLMTIAEDLVALSMEQHQRY
jgi:hypothetical protein